MDFQPGSPSFMALANDGGLYLSDSPEPNFWHVKNLPVTQFYTCEIDFLQPDRLYGGTQDNGTLRNLGGGVGDWEDFLGGDGFYVLVDPTNSDCVYAESQYGNLFHFRNGLGFPANVPQSALERVNWNAPVALDPNDPSIVYFGAQGVYRTTGEPDEFEQARVPGALPIPLGEVPARVEEVPGDGTVYLICAKGGRSLAAAEFLRTRGIDAVNVLGGTEAWVVGGFPVETGLAT